jgi:hypothetical protein
MTDTKELNDIEQWLDHLDPHTTPARDARYLRRIREAADVCDAAKTRLDEVKVHLDNAVGEARAHGDSWGLIGMVLGISRQAAQQRFSDIEQRDRGFVTQRITAKDIQAGRIRLPAKGKTLLPPARSNIDVVVKGKTFNVRWDPRNDPDRTRSGILAFGRGKLQGIVLENEVLAIRVASVGIVELDLDP